MAEIYSRIKKPSDILVTVKMSPFNGHHLGNIEWEVIFFIKESGHRITLKKEECFRQDEDTYLCPVATGVFEDGVLRGTLHPRFPSSYFSDGYKDEYIEFNPNIILY